MIQALSKMSLFFEKHLPRSKVKLSFERVQATFSIQITTSHLAKVDCATIMILNLLPEVLLVVTQQQTDFMRSSCQTCWPKVELQASFPRLQTGNPWPPLLSLSHVLSCLKWMLTAVSTHSQTASSKASGAVFTEMFA